MNTGYNPVSSLAFLLPQSCSLNSPLNKKPGGNSKSTILQFHLIIALLIASLHCASYELFFLPLLTVVLIPVTEAKTFPHFFCPFLHFCSTLNLFIVQSYDDSAFPNSHLMTYYHE